MGLYEPAIEKMRVDEIRAKRKQKRELKSAYKQAEKEKYKRLYKQELEKERAKLKAQRESDIEEFKTKRAIEKAHARARARVKPFTPSTIFKIHPKRLTPEQKRKLKKAGVEIGKTTVSLGKSALKMLDAMYSDKPTKRKPAKRKYKKKTTKRKYTPTKRKYKKKTAKRKGKTYYCRKCHKRHSYSSKIGRKHK